MFSGVATAAGVSDAAAKNQTSGVTWAELEIPKLSIKLSNDGTGIISKVSCGGCGYKFAKITKNTNAYVNGVMVDLFRARERAGRQARIYTICSQYLRSHGNTLDGMILENVPSGMLRVSCRKLVKQFAK